MAETFKEFKVVVDVRGVNFTQETAETLIEAILSREMDHHGLDWGAENKMSFRVPGLLGKPEHSDFYPGDDDYETKSDEPLAWDGG